MNIRYSIAALSLVCAACSSSGPQPAQPEGTMDTGPVIVRVVSRDSTIVARAGAAGPVYSMQDSTGKVLVPDMTLQQMQAANPEVAQHIQSITASTVGIWAGVE